MDLKRKGERPYVICGMAAILLFTLAVMILGLADDKWSIGTDSISRLGVTPTAWVATTFNIICYITGILLAIYGIGKIIFEDGLYCAGGAFLMTSGIGAFFVGIFTDSFYPQHAVVAGIFAVGMGLALVFLTIADIMSGERWMAIFGFILMIVVIGSAFIKPETAQVACLACVFAWFIVHFTKCYKKGMLESSFPEASP